MGAPVTHGALDHAKLAALGLQPEALLDFSSNLNPFGPPPGVRAALASLDPAPYPDRACHALRQKLVSLHGYEIRQTLVGNGSNELIHLIARVMLARGDMALVIGPTFGEYAHASERAGAHVVEWHAQRSPPFTVEMAHLAATILRLRPRLVWLCSPNNPTGVELSLSQLRQIADMCTTVGGMLVIDHAYHALRRGGAVEPFGVLPNTMHLHSLTKSYALAGLRLGYMLGEAGLLEQVAAFQPTWSVSSAAQVAGLAALNDSAFLSKTMPPLWVASDWLRASIERLGLATWRGMLPFLLVRTGDGAATRAALLAHACVVRDCASFGLPEWVRVAPRQPRDNERLIAAWKEIL